MTTVVYSELLLFDMPIHGWVLNFGIFMVLIGLVFALVMQEWMYGTRKWHHHLIKRSFANRVLVTLREKGDRNSTTDHHVGGSASSFLPYPLEKEEP